MTMTPRLSPLIIRLRCGKVCLFGWQPQANSETIAPRSRIWREARYALGDKAHPARNPIPQSSAPRLQAPPHSRRHQHHRPFR
jgi:hypothetical protein